MVEICDNGIDDNCNGLIDDEDPQCGICPCYNKNDILEFAKSQGESLDAVFRDAFDDRSNNHVSFIDFGSEGFIVSSDGTCSSPKSDTSTGLTDQEIDACRATVQMAAEDLGLKCRGLTDEADAPNTCGEDWPDN